jgi:hypothetical protein
MVSVTLRMSVSKIEKTIKRVGPDILQGLAWLFVASCVALLLLGASGLEKRWNLDMPHLGFLIVKFVLVPFFVCWGCINGSLILCRLTAELKRREGRPSAWSVALFITWAIFGIGIMFMAIYWVIRFA